MIIYYLFGIVSLRDHSFASYIYVSIELKTQHFYNNFTKVILLCHIASIFREKKNNSQGEKSNYIYGVKRCPCQKESSYSNMNSSIKIKSKYYNNNVIK